MEPSSLILIGASTGGPGRIHTILSSLNPQFQSPIVIAQHMALPFIPSFIKQLQSISPLPVKEIGEGILVKNGHIYVCAVTSHFVTKNGEIWLEPSEEKDYSYNPEINILFHSASSLNNCIRRLAIILTGIGDDGAQGSLALHEAGSECYFENEESATVFGMPRRSKELVEEAKTGNMSDIIAAIHQFGEKHVRMV
ncbi:MAG TPA: CheB methylesterase domain-containing protein [Sulfuricurvum sp.]|nr:CheB methylesterase domain-containing protein [Sulfuricurvum sp.]